MRRLGLAAFAAALIGVAADRFIKDDALVASVEKKVREVQPTRAEKRFDEIGWAPSILQGELAAKASNRPLFLFTYNGNMDIGRC